ncbi:MAG: TonB-dependent receptor family protein [Bacteroidota bacterium]|nr:TonB-dependent receptor family protein [Bacteroidota bacterium]
MFKRLLALCIVVCTAGIATAQSSGSVKGRLVDTVAKQSMKDATIAVLDVADSSLEVSALSVDGGSFEVKNIALGTWLAKITFQGYEPVFKRFTISKNDPIVNMGTIFMKIAPNDLGTVTVTQSPIVIKKDTVEFNASMFKTKPNAVAEDLLKKLPGIDVDKSGGVKAQGETVQRILVNGKRFFGDDPKMATKNLPPDVIDKIQVFDDLSDQSKFTGFDDGNRVKTINITTKKDKQKGYFGKAVAGIGDNNNYDESFNLHRFNGSQQISILGQGNDINKQNFTPQDILGGGSRGGRGGGGFNVGGGSTGSGITTTWAGGANYRDSWGKNKTTDVTGSYFYNNQSTATDQDSYTQNILTSDSSTYNSSRQSSVTRNQNHRINLNIESRLDSMNSIVFRPNISIQNTSPSSSSSTVTTGGPNGIPIYTSVSNNYSNNSGFSINGANFQFRHRFNKRYRTLSLDMNFSGNKNDGDGYVYSVNTFYNPVSKLDTINQHYIDSSHSYTISPTLSYTEPIGKNQIIELNYNYTLSASTSINNSYQYDNIAHTFTKFDSLFSNSYKYNSQSNRVTLNYRLQGTKFDFSVGSGMQWSDITSDNTTKNVQVKQNFLNITPTAIFSYNYSRTKRLRIFYSGRTGQPSVSQLQPIKTTSDSINFTVGNPNLHPQFTHSLRVLYSSFDAATQRVIFATINASAITNDIQSSITQLPNGSKISTYENLSGTYSVSGYFNYGFPLKKPKSNLNFTTNLGYNQSQTLVNLASNFTRNTTLGETIKWTTNLKDNFDMNFSSSTTYNIARYTLQPKQNIDYLSQTFSAEFTYYTHSGWIVATDFDYTYYGNRAPGYNSSVPLLNPSIAKQFLKNKAGELRLTCFDLLNQNVSVTRNITSNTVQDVRTNVLTRYVMLTFTYNLRNFFGQQQRMPGMFQMFRGMRPPGGGGFGGFGGSGFGGGRRS